MRVQSVAALLLLAFALLLFNRPVPIAAQNNVQSGTIHHDGLERTYLLYVPSGYDGDQAVPLLVGLHGGGGSGREFMRGTGFNEIAETEGFIAVYPDGVDGWNDGREIGTWRIVDDVGFIAALLDELSQNFNIDQERIFVTGGSNGGLMSFRLACELPDRFAAFATVIANMNITQAETCNPGQPIPAFMMMGTADPLMPFDGGSVGSDLGRRGEVISAEATARFWVENNRCSGEDGTMELPDVAPEDGARVYVTLYADCDAPVQWYVMEGGGHGWPGRPQQSPEWRVGTTVQDVDASQVIWDFFAQVTPDA